MAGPDSFRKRAREHNNAIRTNSKKARFIHHCQQNYHSSSEDSNNDDATSSFFPNSITAKMAAEEHAAYNSEGEEKSEDGVEVTQEDSEQDDDENKRLNEQEEGSSEEDGGKERDKDEGGVNVADDDDEADNDEFDEVLLAQDSSASDSDSDSPANSNVTTMAPRKSKKNDPASFALSMQKILTTKTKSADPMLSRSSAAQAASRTAIDSALEAKAKKILKESNLLALEKGRVKDVLDPSVVGMPEVQLSAARSMEEEKRLRKVAQKGVIRLFNVVRAAQVRATEAQRVVREEGVLGIKKREETVQKMTKKGFLDLIASGGGRLKKGPIEEA